MRNFVSGENRKRTKIASFSSVKNQRGSAAVDYAVILVFVVLGVIAVIVALQGNSDLIFKATATVIGDFGSIKE